MGESIDSLFPKGILYQIRIAISWDATACSLEEKKFRAHSMSDGVSSALGSNGTEIAASGLFGRRLSDCVQKYMQFDDGAIRRLSTGVQKEPCLIAQMSTNAPDGPKISHFVGDGEREDGEVEAGASRKLERQAVDAYSDGNLKKRPGS